MAINFNNQNGIGTLDLSQFGLMQPQNTNMQVAEAFNYGTLPQATKSFTPKSTMTTGAVVDGFIKENPNANRGDFMKALQDGSLGSSASQLFNKNVDSLFEGVNLDKNYFGNVTPTYQGTTDGTFRGNIDIDKGSLNEKALESLPEGFFKSIGDQSSLGLPANDRYASLNSFFSPATMNDATNTNAPAANDLSGLDLNRFAGVSNLGRNDMDVEQVEQLGSPSRFQGLQNKIGAGFNNVKDFAIDKGNMGRNLIGSAGAMAMGLPGIVGSGAMSLLGGLGNMFEDRQLSGKGTTVDEYGNSYNASDLNKMNAKGGYYTDAARSSRRRTNRINKMLARRAKGKRISAENLIRLQAQEKAQEVARQAATTQMANDNRDAGDRGGYQSSFGGDSGFMGGSGTAADMGSFRDGGVASMFTRRR